MICRVERVLLGKKCDDYGNNNQGKRDTGKQYAKGACLRFRLCDNGIQIDGGEAAKYAHNNVE